MFLFINESSLACLQFWFLYSGFFLHVTQSKLEARGGSWVYIWEFSAREVLCFGVGQMFVWRAWMSHQCWNSDGLGLSSPFCCTFISAISLLYFTLSLVETLSQTGTQSCGKSPYLCKFRLWVINQWSMLAWSDWTSAPCHRKKHEPKAPSGINKHMKDPGHPLSCQNDKRWITGSWLHRHIKKKNTTQACYQENVLFDTSEQSERCSGIAVMFDISASCQLSSTVVEGSLACVRQQNFHFFIESWTLLHDRVSISKWEVKCQNLQQLKLDFCDTEQGNDLHDPVEQCDCRSQQAKTMSDKYCWKKKVLVVLYLSETPFMKYKRVFLHF